MTCPRLDFRSRHTQISFRFFASEPPKFYLNFGKLSRNSGCNDVANAISNCSKSRMPAPMAPKFREILRYFKTFRSAVPTVTKYWPTFWRNFQRPTEHLNFEKKFAKLWSRATYVLYLSYPIYPQARALSAVCHWQAETEHMQKEIR